MKEYYVDRWAKVKAEYLWKEEKNRAEVVKVVQEKGSVQDIMEVIEEKQSKKMFEVDWLCVCLLYTSPSPRDAHESRMPSSA